MNRYQVIATIVGALILGCVGGARGSTADPRGVPPPKEPGQLSLHTDRVVVFKDGYGLFAKSATALADAEGRVFTEEVPDRAILGCFWAFGENGPVRSITAEMVERKATHGVPTPCISILDLLRANVGKPLILEVGWGGGPCDIERVSCRIVSVLDSPALAGDAAAPSRDVSAPLLSCSPSPHSDGVMRSSADSGFAPPGTTIRELVPRGGELVLVETAEKQQRVIPVSRIGMLRSLEPFSTTTTRAEEVTTRTKRLTFDLGREAAHRTITLQFMYFSEGIRWIPAYRLSGDLETKGELALQGEILNEAEPLDGAVVELVGGVPNFRFKSVPSPLILERQLRLALPQAAPGLVAIQVSNQMMQQAFNSFENRQPGPVATDDALALAPELGTEPAMDLFAYSLGAFSLKKGARAAVSLWTSPVALDHLYTVDFRVLRSREGGKSIRSGREGADSPLNLNPNRVWHQLEITNTTKAPWTTGSVFLMRNQLPLGQDLLTYTPIRGTTLVPVTVAVDVRASFADQEIERRINALRWNDHDYALVRLRGTVTLTNSQDKPVRVRPKVAVGGRAENASDQGTVMISDYRSEDWTDWQPARYNNHSEVQWTLTLQPGESKTLTFEYGYYI